MMDLSTKQQVRESDITYILDIGEFLTVNWNYITILTYNVILQTMMSY